MRTLRQIDNEIMDASKKRAEELKDTLTAEMMSQNEIIAFQCSLRSGDVYRQMYHTLAEIEKYLLTLKTPEAAKLVDQIKEI